MGLTPTMRIVIAPDKFKGSLTATQAAEAIAVGARRAAPEAILDSAPIADGGEGIVEALVAATGGRYLSAWVTGPLPASGREGRVEARYGLLGDGETAVLEMAAASGLVLVSRDQRDPWRATTRGTGELIAAALDSGAERIILGIGGSATNDGGAGMAQALGYKLRDAEGRELSTGGGALADLRSIDSSGRDRRLDQARIAVACDVDNPLCGPRGASAIYGPQKGASPEMIRDLDQGLENFARVVKHDLGASVRDLPGAGAAGGLGAGLVAFAGGRLQPGIDLVLEATRLRERLKDADLCLTAEGSIDASTAHGKAVAGVARLASSLGCPTFAFGGRLGEGAREVLSQGVTSLFCICPGPISESVAIERAFDLLADVAEQAVRAFIAGRSCSRDSGQ